MDEIKVIYGLKSGLFGIVFTREYYRTLEALSLINSTLWNFLWTRGQEFMLGLGQIRQEIVAALKESSAGSNLIDTNKQNKVINRDKIHVNG